MDIRFDKPTSEHKEYIIPFSKENLEKIQRIANFHSIFFQRIVSYSHNNFEIRVHVEAFDEPPLAWDQLEAFNADLIEPIFIQFMALYRISQNLGLDFIDFTHFRLLRHATSHFSLQFSISPIEKKEAHFRSILHAFQKNPHFRNYNLTEKNAREIFARLAGQYQFESGMAYIYRFDDFSSAMLNGYPLADLKNGANLKIRINTTDSVQKTIIRTNLYHTHWAEDICFVDIRETVPPVPLPVHIARILPEDERQTSPDDVITTIHRLNLFLKKSSFKSMIWVIDHLASEEDARFLDVLLESRQAGGLDTTINIVLICFGTSGIDSLRFDLEFNERPVNLIEKYLIVDADGPLDPLCETEQMDKKEIRELQNLVLEGQELHAVKETILNREDYRESLALKLLLAYSYRWEKEYAPLRQLLAEVKKSIDSKHPFHDMYRYLEFLIAEKESDLKTADRQLKHVRGDYFRKRAAIQLSDRYIYRGDFTHARDLLTDAADYFHRCGQVSDEIETLSQSAKLHREQHETDAAEKLYQNLFIKSEMKRYPFLSADIAVDLANLYITQNNFNQAGVWYKKALNIFQYLQNPNGIHLVKSNMVHIDKITGNWQEARIKLESVLGYYQERNAATPMAIDYFNIAHLEYLKHNFSTALEFLERSMAHFKETGKITPWIDGEILKQKVHFLSGAFDKVDLSRFAEYRNHLSDDQTQTLSLMAMVRQKALNPKESAAAPIARMVQHLNAITCPVSRFDLLVILLSQFRNPQLLERFKSLSMALSQEKKNYFYYEYYYQYYNHFVRTGQWGRYTEDGTPDMAHEVDRFTDVYYFFLKNQRALAMNIVRHKQLLDERESHYDIFKSAELIGDAMHWKIPDDFFRSLMHQIRTVFPSGLELVKLIIYEPTDHRDPLHHPLFHFSTTTRFSELTDEIIASAIRRAEPLNLSAEDIKNQPIFRSSEKVFYCFPNTRVILWKIAEKLFGGLLLAFSTDAYEDYDFRLRHDDLFKKYGALIHRFYENDFKLNQKLDFIIGESPAVNRLKQQILKVSKVDFSVLIRGESGTGKEFVAKAIHLLSDRSAKTFVPVNAAAIPENLLEAELFGYKKGAFTGAAEGKTGLIEEASGGTLFLDEIADLPLNLQAKLLRVLQENEIRRLGENQMRPVNIRLVSATNKALTEMVVANQFREDLYFRIQDLTVQVPPLRERMEDIALLVPHFLKKYGFSIPDTQELSHIIHYFKGRTWAGNIRELESNVKRFITYYPDFEMDTAISFPTQPHPLDEGNVQGGLIAARETLERTLILRTLSENNWNRAKTAAALKITRQYLFNLINKYGIKSPGL
ncbi:MAG: sigma 54-interacting transcriptional regulator [Candidatus Omnitrophota bacterium]